MIKEIKTYWIFYSYLTDFIKPYGKIIEVNNSGRAYVQVNETSPGFFIQASLPFIPTEEQLEEITTNATDKYIKEWDYFCYMYSNLPVVIKGLIQSVILRYHSEGLL